MRHLCAITILATALLKAHAAQNAAAEIPLEFREGLIWIKATVPQSGEALNFLLDTGAGTSVLSQSTAERLGLRSGSAVPVRGVSISMTGYKLESVSARAGDVALPADYLALDLSKLSRSCQRPVDGLLGADFFRGRAVQIDFKERKLRILKTDQTIAFGEVLPLQLRPCGMRVPITVNGQKRQGVRLDTGCVSDLQWVTSRVRSSDCKPQVAIGLTEVAIPQAETTVEIGHEKFEKVLTGLHDQPIFAGEAGLLGNGLLSRFSRVTIDGKSRRLILQR